MTECALLINGRSLSTIFENEELSEKVVSLFQRAESVVVFRSSPDEKAQTVKFIMKHEPSAFSLAIGDGANDVNMIQSASIGVGIMGKEGNQAATFSDYAMPTFQGLRRLIFWHGRHFGTKSITFLSYALFKSQAFMVPILVVNMTNGFSGLAIYRDFYFALFDVLNTTFMLGGFVLLDQDVAFDSKHYRNDAKENEDPAFKQRKLVYDPNVKEPI